jgi:hypothetical protein
VFVPPLLLDVDEFKLRIAAAIETINRNMLERAWDELDYRLDICRSRMELTLSIFRACKTFRVCHLNDTSYNYIAVLFTLVQQIKGVSIIYGHSVLGIGMVTDIDCDRCGLLSSRALPNEALSIP